MREYRGWSGVGGGGGAGAEGGGQNQSKSVKIGRTASGGRALSRADGRDVDLREVIGGLQLRNVFGELEDLLRDLLGRGTAVLAVELDACRPVRLSAPRQKRSKSVRRGGHGAEVLPGTARRVRLVRGEGRGVST